jgi:hypothetical protein
MVKDAPRLSRWEILGAWLNVWTPPRDAHVPPIPWRKLAVGGLLTLLVAGGALALIAPRIDDAKEERAAREQRELDQRWAARRERIAREQQPRTGRLEAGAGRGEAVAAVEAAIGADARRRFDPDARPATCEPAEGADPAAARVAYDCLSAVRDIVGAADQTGARGTLGIPFRAVIDFEAGSYAFCKTNPPPGEQVIPDPRTIVELPRACRS